MQFLLVFPNDLFFATTNLLLAALCFNQIGQIWDQSRVWLPLKLGWYWLPFIIATYRWSCLTRDWDNSLFQALKVPITSKIESHLYLRFNFQSIWSALFINLKIQSQSYLAASTLFQYRTVITKGLHHDFDFYQFPRYSVLILRQKDA